MEAHDALTSVRTAVRGQLVVFLSEGEALGLAGSWILSFEDASGDMHLASKVFCLKAPQKKDLCKLDGLDQWHGPRAAGGLAGFACSQERNARGAGRGYNIEREREELALLP